MKGSSIPPPAPVSSVPQMMLPALSVSSACVQLATVESLMPPPVMMIPAWVEVADVERRVNVEVAVVEVAVKCEATTSPTTDNLAYGEVVPMPTEPRE